MRLKINNIRMQSHQVNIQLKLEKQKYCKLMLLEINKELNLSKLQNNKFVKNKLNNNNNINSNSNSNEIGSCCIICEENINNMVMVPCGHRYLCENCRKEIKTINTCDICKKDVKMIIKTYNSGSIL